MNEKPKLELEVGKTSATDRDPNTSDKFTFWLAPEIIVNTFDIVVVEQVSHEGKSGTFGLVTILENRTDAPTHLSNFISSNFGNLTEEQNTPRQGTTIAHVNVLSNDKDIYMPVQSDKIVKFVDEEGIHIALGIDTMEAENRIPAGLIKMNNGTTAVAYINRRFNLQASPTLKQVVKAWGSPYVLENIRIPKFDPKNKLHLYLAELSQKAHESAEIDDQENLKDIEEEIDEVSAQIWELTKEELNEIKISLKELAENV